MEKQCAGCGTVFEDGNEPLGAVSPRPHGCCPECNGHTFRSNEKSVDSAENISVVSEQQSKESPASGVKLETSPAELPKVETTPIPESIPTPD